MVLHKSYFCETTRVLVSLGPEVDLVEIKIKLLLFCSTEFHFIRRWVIQTVLGYRFVNKILMS
jgi:hypothetical protein